MTALSSQWLEPPDALALGGSKVHVWRAELDRPAAYVDGMLRTLREDERARADRFYRSEDRARFICTRGTLRTLLGRYLGEEPGGLRFEYNRHGKPYLAEGQGAGPALCFNVSHSEGYALLAFTRGRELGVDLERIQPGFAHEELAGRFFSAREVSSLGGLPRDLRAAAFFTCWTRKEAYIKARGQGLSIPLDTFEVSLAPGEVAALLRADEDPHGAGHWSLRDLPAVPDFAAALAAEGADWELKCWQF